VSVLHAEPITFETNEGTTHSPLVHAVVNGVGTRLVLDTGASDHILTMDVCEAANLATEPGEPGTDSTGSSVPSWQAREVTIRIGELELALAEVIAIDTPPPFRSRGIGGTLSPQHLRPGASAVLDLSADPVATLVPAEDLDAWLAETYPGRRAIRLPAFDGDGTVLVEMAIDSFPPIIMMLDTGARTTYAARTAVPGLGDDGVRRSTGRGVGGTEAFGVDVPGRVLHVGDASLPVDLVIAEHDLGLPGCVVGMDVLRGTVLAVGPPGSSVRWLLPEPEAQVPGQPRWSR
jgi:Aspartyl protease